MRLLYSDWVLSIIPGVGLVAGFIDIYGVNSDYTITEVDCQSGKI